MYFQLPVLPFKDNALEPFMSSETVRTHYLGHHKSYIDTLNELLVELDGDQGSLERIIQNFDGIIYNNAAQAWNHTFFWHGLTEASRSEMPEDSGDFDEAVERSFGGWSSMRAKFISCAKSVFGSGYVWLTVDGQNHLEFLSTPNAGNPLRFDRVRPLWTCDVWEHAYYLDYKSLRSEYVDKVWDYVNWDFVEHNYLHEGTPNMSKFMVANVKTEEPIVPHSRPALD